MLRLLTANLRLKLISLGIALLMYFFIAFEAETSTELDVPLKVLTSPGVVLTTEVPAALQVTYRGTFATLRQLQPGSLAPHVIDLRERAPGPVSITMQPDQMPRLSGLEALSVQPSVLTLRLDQVIERQVPIRAEVRGKPATGYMVGETVVSPRRATIGGPTLDVEQVRYVLTRPIDITGATASLTTDVALRSPAYPITLKGSDSVAVTVQIEEDYIERYLRAVPVVLDSKQPGLGLKTTSVSFSIRGPILAIEALDPKKIRATITIPETDNLTVGVLELVPEIEGLPERVYLLGASPTVAVEYKPPRRPVRQTGAPRKQEGSGTR